MELISVLLKITSFFEIGIGFIIMAAPPDLLGQMGTYIVGMALIVLGAVTFGFSEIAEKI